MYQSTSYSEELEIIFLTGPGILSIQYSYRVIAFLKFETSRYLYLTPNSELYLGADSVS